VVPGSEAPVPEDVKPDSEETAASPAETPGGVAEGEEKEAPSVPEEEAPPGSFLVEIDGREEEIPVTDLVKGYQLARDAHKHITEAIQAKKESEVLRKGILNDHWNTYHQALVGAGADSDEALRFIVEEAKALAAEYGKFEKLPKEQQEVITLRRKLAQREAELERAQTETATRAETDSVTQAKAAALSDITGAMKGAGIKIDVNTAATRIFIQDVARRLLDAPSMSTQDAVKEVQKDVLKQLEERLKIADQFEPGAIQGLLPNLAEHVRKSNLNGIKRAQSARVVPKESAIKRPAQSKPVVLRDGDWEKYFSAK
jgi:hypothetical protein